MNSKEESRGAWLLAAGGLLLGTLGIFIEEAGVHPLTAVWFRCAFGLAALIAWLYWRGRLHELRLPRRAGWLAVIGSLAPGTYDVAVTLQAGPPAQVRHLPLVVAPVPEARIVRVTALAAPSHR